MVLDADILQYITIMPNKSRVVMPKNRIKPKKRTN